MSRASGETGVDSKEAKPLTRGGARPGAGRKPSPVKLKIYTYKATEQEHQQMQANADRQGVTLSEFIRSRCIEVTRHSNHPEAGE